MKRNLGVLFLLLLTSCTPLSREYQLFYSHLGGFRPSSSKAMVEDDYFLVILVDACHLDYTDACQFFKSVARHPMNRSRGDDVGHAWIYLQGKDEKGGVFSLEGGHSGELGDSPPRYFDGLMNYVEYGYADPTPEQKKKPRYEPNPIKYLWTVREDGIFEKGSGGHQPTFAAKVSLTREQFNKILSFIKPSVYPYQNYALIGPQCCTFVVQVAALAGMDLETEMKMSLSPSFFYGRTKVRLWEDPRYSSVAFSTPDLLEKSLIEAVKKGKAEYALDWYLSDQKFIIEK